MINKAKHDQSLKPRAKNLSMYQIELLNGNIFHKYHFENLYSSSNILYEDR